MLVGFGVGLSAFPATNFAATWFGHWKRITSLFTKTATIKGRCTNLVFANQKVKLFHPS